MAFTYTGEQVDLGFGRGWLNRPAANSIRRIDAQIGHALQITEAGRTWAKQNEHYQRYLRDGWPIALSPNAPSVHQKGGATDSNEAQRIHARMEDNGWRRTVYRWVNGVWTLVEPWHHEYFEHLDNHRNDPTPAAAGANHFEEDDMFNAQNGEDLAEALRLLRLVVMAPSGRADPKTEAEVKYCQIVQGDSENAAEARRMGGVILGAIPPAPNESRPG